MKKILVSIISLSLIFSMSTTTYASEITSKTEENVITEQIASNDISFADMTVEELNAFIDNIADKYAHQSRVTIVPSEIQLAWLAAAEIARDEGYECAALMVEHSVYDMDYSEASLNENTPLIDKLITTNAYKNHVEGILDSDKTSYTGSFTIKKSDNTDLFYALHKVSTSARGYLVGTLAESYTITISDTFDFALDNDYDDLFTTLVNNWAWLCQQTGVLNPISITLHTIES